MERKKLNFFKQLWITFFRPDQYGRLASSSTGRMIGFVFLFSLLYAIVWIGSMLLILDIIGLKQIIRENTPDFYFINGELHLDEPYNLADDDFFLCADSEIEQFGLSDLEYIKNNADYETIVLIGKKNLLGYEASSGEYVQLEFSKFKDSKYTRDGILDMFMSKAKQSFMLISLIIFPFLAIIHFMAALFFALIAMIFSALFRKRLSGGQVYRIGIHVYAAILLASLIFEVYLFIIPDPIAQFVYFVLGAAYILIGVLSTDNQVSANRQDMAQRAAGPYSSYGESGEYYGQDAFSNEPIKFDTPESRTTGSNMNGNTYNSAQTKNAGNGTSQENDNSYGMDMAFYGMNVISLDGTMQTVNPVENKFESKPEEETKEETAEANEESYISYHTGLATNVISFESTEPVQAYPPVPQPAKDTVMINGMECQKSDLDLVDKYLLVGLKDSAIDNLCQLLNCTKEAAEEVIANWKQYYNE